MDNIGKGVATVGIWIGVGLMCFGKIENFGFALCVFFAMVATIVVWKHG